MLVHDRIRRPRFVPAYTPIRPNHYDAHPVSISTHMSPGPWDTARRRRGAVVSGSSATLSGITQARLRLFPTEFLY